MSHTFISLDMNLIPKSTKENDPTFSGGLFSNDNSRMLIDGRNESGQMVHPMAALLKWTQWSDNPEQVVNALIAGSIEHTMEEFMLLKNNINSIWYADRDDK